MYVGSIFDVQIIDIKKKRVKGKDTSMKKRLFTVLLVTLMTLSFTGCSLATRVAGLAADRINSEAQEEDINPSVDVEPEEIIPDDGKLDETIPEDANQDENTQDTDAQDADAQEVLDSDYIKYSIEHEYEYDDTMIGDDYVYLSCLYYDTINIESPGCDELKKSIDEFNKALVERLDEEYSEIKSWAQMAAEDIHESEYDVHYHMEENLKIVRADSDYFTILGQSSSYSGGAHGYSGYAGYNFDSKTGKELTLDDILEDKETAAYAIAQDILENHEAAEFFAITDYDASEEVAQEQLSNAIYNDYLADGHEYDLNFVLGNNGIHFYFNPYAIAPYASGIIHAMISYDEQAGMINQNLNLARENYIEPMFYGLYGTDTFYADIDNGWYKNVSIGAEYGYSDDYQNSWIEKLVVYVNQEKEDEIKIETEAYGYEFDSYFIANNGRYFIYADLLSDSDYHTLYCFEVTGGEPEYVGLFPGQLLPGSDVSALEIGSRIFLLSSYDGLKRYKIGYDGLPDAIDDYFSIIHIDLPLVSTRDLEVYTVSEDDITKDLKKITCPKGTEFSFKYTGAPTDSTKDWVVFELEDKSLVKIYIDTRDYPFKIDGIPEDDCFEILYYAG